MKTFPGYAFLLTVAGFMMLFSGRWANAHPPRGNARINREDYDQIVDFQTRVVATGFEEWEILFRYDRSFVQRKLLFEILLIKKETGEHYSDVLEVWVTRPQDTHSVGQETAPEILRIEPVPPDPYRVEWGFVRQGKYRVHIRFRDKWFGPTTSDSTNVVVEIPIEIKSDEQDPVVIYGFWFILLGTTLTVGIVRHTRSRPGGNNS